MWVIALPLAPARGLHAVTRFAALNVEYDPKTNRAKSDAVLAIDRF